MARHREIGSRFLAVVLSFGLLVTAPSFSAKADALSDDFWDRMNDALTEKLLERGDPTKFDELMREGQIADPGSISGLSVRTFEKEEGRLDVVLGTDVGSQSLVYVMQPRDGADVALPGFRGSLSDCTEVNELDCSLMTLTHRSDFTLGVAACLCEREARRERWRGRDAAYTPCWIGRGATYMDFILVYDDPTGSIGTTLASGHGPGPTSICAASKAAQNYPQFMVSRFVGLPVPPPDDIDVDAWPVAILAGTGGLEDVLQKARLIDEHALP